MREIYNNKYFGEFMRFRWHGDFKVGCLSTQLLPKPG